MKNKKYRSSYKTNSKRNVFIVLAILLIMGVVIYWVTIRSESNQTTTTKNIDESSEEIDYAPPSEEESSDTDRVKDDISSQNDTQTTTSNDSSGAKTVEVVLTNWGQSDSGTRFEVGAYAQVLEPNGKCKLTMKKGAVTLSDTSTAIQNPSTMSCGSLSVEYSKVTSGTWTTTISYTSPKSDGTVTKQIKWSN